MRRGGGVHRARATDASNAAIVTHPSGNNNTRYTKASTARVCQALDQCEQHHVLKPVWCHDKTKAAERHAYCYRFCKFY